MVRTRQLATLLLALGALVWASYRAESAMPEGDLGGRIALAALAILAGAFVGWMYAAWWMSRKRKEKRDG